VSNGTSAQLGYTEDKFKIQTIHKLNTTQKKQTTQNSKTKLP